MELSLGGDDTRQDAAAAQDRHAKRVRGALDAQHDGTVFILPSRQAHGGVGDAQGL